MHFDVRTVLRYLWDHACGVAANVRLQILQILQILQMVDGLTSARKLV